MKIWLKKPDPSGEKPDTQLRLAKADLMRHEAAGITVDRYPKKMTVGGTELGMTYHFEPGSLKDGVTLVVPLTLLNQVDGRRCEWLVPGMCEEKTLLLLKSLPQKVQEALLISDWALAILRLAPLMTPLAKMSAWRRLSISLSACQKASLGPVSPEKTRLAAPESTR